jgi:hypothetical protein
MLVLKEPGIRSTDLSTVKVIGAVLSPILLVMVLTAVETVDKSTDAKRDTGITSL